MLLRGQFDTCMTHNTTTKPPEKGTPGLVTALGLRISSIGFTAQDLGYRVKDLGFRI